MLVFFWHPLNTLQNPSLNENTQAPSVWCKGSLKGTPWAVGSHFGDPFPSFTGDWPQGHSAPPPSASPRSQRDRTPTASLCRFEANGVNLNWRGTGVVSFELALQKPFRISFSREPCPPAIFRGRSLWKNMGHFLGNQRNKKS